MRLSPRICLRSSLKNFCKSTLALERGDVYDLFSLPSSITHSLRKFMSLQNIRGFTNGNQVLDTCMRSGGGGLPGGLLGTYFVSAYGSKLGVIEGSSGGTLVVITGW